MRLFLSVCDNLQTSMANIYEFIEHVLYSYETSSEHSTDLLGIYKKGGLPDCVAFFKNYEKRNPLGGGDRCTISSKAH